MSLFSKDHKPAGGPAQITIISEHLSVTGEISGVDNVYINGSFKGRIVTKGEVSIGPKGNVDAEIETRSLLVSGYLEGNIQCEAITIFPSGQVIGNLCSSTLKLHPGGYYFGESTLRIVQHESAATQTDAGKPLQLSVVPALPEQATASKAFAASSTPASPQEQKYENSKISPELKSKFNVGTAVKAVMNSLEIKHRPPETPAADENTVHTPVEVAEERRWHSSWGRR